MKLPTLFLGLVSSTLVHSQATTPADTAPTTASVAPSPTESTGCELHGDHWHCDAAVATAVTNGTAVAATATIDAAGTGTLSPSPTESIGCEPHGDHWHCDGPAETAASAASSLRATTYGAMVVAVVSMLGSVAF